MIAFPESITTSREIIERYLTDRDKMRELWIYACRLTKNYDVADDLVQEVCLRALRNAESYDPNRRVKARKIACGQEREDEENRRVKNWIYAIMRNLSCDQMRKREFRRENQIFEYIGEVLEPASIEDDPEAMLMAHERTEALRAGLDTLPEETRETISRCYFLYETQTQREAAKAMGVTRRVVERQLRSTKEMLRGKLEGVAA